MTGRERFLMYVGLGAAGLLVLFVGYAFVWAPLDEAWSEKRKAEEELANLQNDYNAQVKKNDHVTKLNPRLVLAQKLSLPRSDPVIDGKQYMPVADRKAVHLANLRSAYDAYLHELLRKAGFRQETIEIKVRQAPKAGGGPVGMGKKQEAPPFERLVFGVSAKGPQEAVYRALRDFHSENLLHVVKDFSVSVAKPEGRKEPDPSSLVFSATVEAMRMEAGEKRTALKPTQLPYPPKVLSEAKRDYLVLKNHSLFTGMKDPPPEPKPPVKEKPREKPKEKPKDPGPSEKERLEVLQYVKVTMLAYNQGKGRWEATLYDQAQGQGEEIKVDLRLYKTFQIADENEKSMLDGKVHYIDAEQMIFEAAKNGKVEFFRARVGDFMDEVWKSPMSATEAKKLGFKKG